MRPMTVKRFAIAAAVALATAATPTFVLAQERDQKAEEASSNPAIYEQIAKALNDIVDNDGVAGLVDRFDAADRKRVQEDLKKSETREFRDLVQRFKKKWQDKYQAEYNPELRIGAVDDNPVTRSEEKGRQVATVEFPARDKEGEDAFQIRMIKGEDRSTWRIDLNDKLSGDRIVNRLRSVLEDLIENDDWMRSSTEAYYTVNRRLIGTLDYDPQAKKVNNVEEDDTKAARKRKAAAKKND